MCRPGGGLIVGSMEEPGMPPCLKLVLLGVRRRPAHPRPRRLIHMRACVTCRAQADLS